jgi:multidrug resistance protein
MEFELDVTRTHSFTAGAEGYPTSNGASNTNPHQQEFQLPEFEVDWVDNDPENPRNWSLAYKFLVVMAMGYGATVISLASTCYSVTIPGLEDDFGITNMVGLLGITTYLLGMAAGSLLLAPLSEMYGRRPIYLVSVGVFTILTLPVALAHNIETILISRFFAAFFGSAMMSNSPGSVNDVVSELHRAMAFGFWSIGPSNGPVLGPIIGGFVFEYLGWRWTNWIVVIMGGLAFVLLASVRETYTPVLLRKRAEKKRQEMEDPRWWSPHDNHLPFRTFCRINISRPINMLLTEPIW